MTLQEQIVYIERRQEDVRKFAAEHRKFDRDYVLAPWQLFVTGMVAGGVLFGAGMIFAKLIAV